MKEILPDKIRKKLKSYSALAGAATLSSVAGNNASGQVNYTNPEDSQVNYNFNGDVVHYIDLNNDGVDDIKLLLTHNEIFQTLSTYSSNINLLAEGLGSGSGYNFYARIGVTTYATGGDYGNALKNNYGDIIDFNDDFLAGKNVLFEQNRLFNSSGTLNISTGGEWTKGESEKFLPVKITESATMYDYYGWVRLSIAPDGKSFTVHDYSLNKVPDTDITAGEKTLFPNINAESSYFCYDSLKNFELDTTYDQMLWSNGSTDKSTTINGNPEKVYVSVEDAIGSIGSDTLSLDYNKIDYMDIYPGESGGLEYTFSLAWTGNVTSVSWKIGNDYAQDSYTYYKFDSIGEYQIIAKAYDIQSQCYFSDTSTVSVGDSSCFAGFDYDIVDTANKKVQFNYNYSASTVYWTFDDGNSSNSKNPSHTFSESSTYNVCLNTYDKDKGCESSDCKNITIPEVPDAEFTFTETQTKGTYLFKNESNKYTSAYWTFGDGTTETSSSDVFHFYESQGSYNVCLNIFDSKSGKSSQECKTLKYLPNECDIDPVFTYSYDPISGETEFQNNTKATNVDKWNWDFGDGTTSTARNPVKRYSKESVYNVVLSAYDTTKECLGYFSQPVEAGNVSCYADFTFQPDTNNGLKINYLNNSSGVIDNYSWSFGNGEQSSLESPAYTYPNPGIYSVGLAVSDANGLCYNYTEKDLIIGAYECKADFEIFVDSTNNTAYFKNNSTVDYENSESYWVFSDGHSSTKANPSHRFAKEGIYSAELTINNSLTQCMDDKIMNFTIGNLSDDSEADFYYLTDNSNNTKFISNSIGKNSSFIWNFGDGSPVLIENDSIASKQYEESGFYNVCLTVINNFSQSNTSCKIVNINEDATQACDADFIFNVNENSLKTSFSDRTKGFANDWYWEFGDGSSSFNQNPEHIYDEPGYYVVKLKAKNTQSGFVSTKYKVVNVRGGNDQIIARYIAEKDSAKLKVSGYPVDFVGISHGDAARMRWDFGDGNTDTTSTTPTHVYEKAGTYNACYTIEDPVLQIEDTYCEEITVGPNSISNTKINSSLVNIFPNPADEYITISFKDKLTSGEYKLLNNNGDLIKTGSVDGSLTEISLKGLNPGVYFIETVTGEGKTKKKIIKE